MRLFHAVYAFNAAGWWVVIAMLAVTLCIFIQFRWAFFRLNRAWFIVGHFTKTNRSNVLQFTVMTSMSYHFVGVWTNEITFQTMKMWWLIVCACWKNQKKNMKLAKCPQITETPWISKNPQTNFEFPKEKTYPNYFCTHNHRGRSSYWHDIVWNHRPSIYPDVHDVLYAVQNESYHRNCSGNRRDNSENDFANLNSRIERSHNPR